ncbi:hypothetical protein NMY22_g11497 [Coprinellus aureogranulatus]|nr:hypothetical protein NMY22_g11497 [Coprinellus aureogranulatus]
MREVKPPSRGTRNRALAADPNEGRCLIENTPNEQGVEMAWATDRQYSKSRSRSVEWGWGMRKGALNLDTRENVFFLGSALNALYKNRKWALLPEERIVDSYLVLETGNSGIPYVPKGREEFPHLNEGIYRYTFLPLSADMERVKILRRNSSSPASSSDAFTTHLYPFHTLPVLTSHIHPKFVLLHLSEALHCEMSDYAYHINLVKTNPLIAKTYKFVYKWCAPGEARSDPTFYSRTLVGEHYDPQTERYEILTDSFVKPCEDEWEKESEDGGGESVCTAPKRVWYPRRPKFRIGRSGKKRPHRNHKLKRRSDAMEEEGEGRGVKRKKVENSLKTPGRTSESGWTEKDAEQDSESQKVPLKEAMRMEGATSGETNISLVIGTHEAPDYRRTPQNCLAAYPRRSPYSAARAGLRMPKVSPISDAARRRAEGADVSKQRWTIENCPEDQIIELAYVFKREHSGDSEMMRSLEYIWGMREGTLNLDTRRNIFFVGKVLHKLYKEGKWVLCPEESILDMFLSKPRSSNFRGSPLFRSGFPNLTGDTYKYTFFPLTEMSDRLLRETRGNQPGPEDMQAHPPPYTTLPAVTSHVHPKFALLRFSQRIVLESRVAVSQLEQNNAPPFSCHRPNVCNTVLRERRKSHLHHPSHASISSSRDGFDQGEGSSDVASGSGDEEEDIESDADERFSDNDSNATLPRRVWYPPPPPLFPPPPRPRQKRPATHSSASDIDCRSQEKHRKMETEEAGWTRASITQWTRACSSSPPPESAPSPSPTINAS